MKKRELQILAHNDREIRMSRTFNAPRALVFEAWTKPELLKRWFGVFGGWSLVVCEVDLRVGGACRYLWHGLNGAKMELRTVYREIVIPERLVSVGSFQESWAEGDETTTTTFLEEHNETTVTSRVLYSSKEMRDRMLRSPMEKGVSAGYQSLDALLSSILGRSEEER